MRNFNSRFNLFAVSAGHKESALNTPQTLDTSMLIETNDITDIDPRFETNKNTMSGKEEHDILYQLGQLTAANLNFNMMQAQHAAFILSYFYGTSTPSAYGTGYKHAISPTPDMENPSFTSALRLGKNVGKMRFASQFVDSFAMPFAKDSWVKLSAQIKGTGKFDETVYEETVNAAYNATSLALLANGVQGADANERLLSVHRIKVQVPTTGEWKDVVFTAVSGATPAVISITAPGGVITPVDYKILYVPTEPAWASFPSRITEPPLRVTDLVIKIGGKWDGSAFQGGHTIAEEVESIVINGVNNFSVEFRPGGTGEYANYVRRKGREHTIKLDRELRDWIIRKMRSTGEYMGIYVKATGAEYESGKNYYVQGVFPRCGIAKHPVTVGDMLLVESGDILVMQDDTYGSAQWEVSNKVSEYAGAA